MNDRTIWGLSAGTVAAMLASALWVGMRLPDGPLPVHWGLDGRPDGFAGKWVALLLPAGITAALCALMAVVRKFEPHADNLARSQGLLNAVWIGLLAVMGAVHLMVLSAALHWPLDAPRLLVIAIGGLFAGVGNFLGKSRPMALVGIRTKWTLGNEDVWIATHRFGGKLMVLAGLAWIAAGLFVPLTPLVWGVLIALELVAALVPIGYSYMVSRG